MIWALLTFLFLAAAVTALARRRSYEPPIDEDEPWRASLAHDDDEEEALDMDEARLAEEAFLASDWEDDADDDESEPWRG